jgi:myosin tail region-interacting protein MTI1
VLLVNASASKSSESLSQPSVDMESQASRSPNSMPLPSAPRRAGPPRKKSAKSPTPPTADIEVPLTEAPDILSTADTPAITKKAEAGDVQREIGEITTESVGPSSHPEATEISAGFPEKESALNDGDLEVEDEKSIHAAPPSHAPDVPDDAEDDDNEAAYQPLAEVPIEHESYPARLDEDVKEPIEQPTDEAEDDEVARRRRVTEKLAKMGGVNPLAPPVQRKPSVDETQTASPVSSPLAKRASLSRQSTDSLPPPQRSQSLRRLSVDSTTTSEGGTTAAQRKLSVDETQSSSPVSPPLVKRASLSRQSTESLQRRQSLRKSSVDSTTVLEESTQEFPSRPSAIPPQSRKSSIDPTVSGSVSDSVSRRESQDGKY